MTLRRRTGVGALLFLVAAGCSQKPAAPAPPSPEILAVVQGEPITAAQFQSAMSSRGIADDPAARRALLDELIHFRALVQEARARGYDRDPAVLAAYENILAGKVRETLSAEAGAAEVTEAEVKAWYESHPAEFTTPAKIRAAMIFVEAAANSSPERLAERRAVIERARTKVLAEPTSGAFALAAAEFSFHRESKFRGGDIGYLVEGRKADDVEPPVLDAAFALGAAGQISEVITSPRGFYLVRLTERIPAARQPLAQVAGRIRVQLTRDGERKAKEQSEAALLEGREVQIFADRLAAVPAPANPRPPAQAQPPSVTPAP
jgi:peptidyl-prolyl cis-trans isomerase D